MCPQLPDMLAMADEQGLSMFTYPVASEAKCAEVISKLFGDRTRLHDVSKHNFNVANSHPMRRIVAEHLQKFTNRLDFKAQHLIRK